MDILYINLADQTGRREALESNFQANNGLQWSLHRVEAVSSQDVADKIPGRIGSGEKACFQSHIRAIELAKQRDGHVLIAEDDIAFGGRSFAAIESALALVPEDSWDVIFTDACITNSHAMIDLLLLRRRNDMPFRLINLARLPFAGSTAYIVNRKSKDKILSLLPRSGPHDVPYDIHLQQAVAGGKLRAFVTFPFTTALSSHADNSQIGPAQGLQAMNAFRRLMWLERDITSAAETVTQAGTDDPEIAAFLKILAVFLAAETK